MTTIEPSTLRRADDPRLSELATSFAGERLVNVRYAMPSGTGWEHGDWPAHVHEVDMGVELVGEAGDLLELSWAVPGREEGLAIGFGRSERRSSNELIELIDVSDTQEWRRVLGQPIETLAISFHIHADDSSARPWSFRIGVSSGMWVTIALGEVTDRFLRYSPDSLLVVFDETTTKAYRILSSPQSAWGEVILQ